MDLSAKIDRSKEPGMWAIVCMNYLGLCVASGKAVRENNMERAKYLAVQADALHKQLWW